MPQPFPTYWGENITSVEMRELQMHCIEVRRAAGARYQQFAEAWRHHTIIRALGEKQKVLAQHLSVPCLALYLSFAGVFRPTV